jgi:ribose transport system ATP-binding protein
VSRGGREGAQSAPAAALSVHDLTKRYGPVTALDDVALEVAPGSIHALIGANGSGKSTLIRVVAGVERGEVGGVISVGGRRLAAEVITPHDAEQAGVRVVHQGATTFPDLSVAENIGLGAGARLPTRWGGSIRWRAARAAAADGLRQLGVDVAPAARVGDLSPAVQTLVAVARALIDVETGDTEHKVVILDEPTAALPAREVATLLGGLRGLADAGHAVVLVTHRLDEVTRAADEATVLRDARRVATFRVGSVPPADVVTMITGRAEREDDRSVGEIDRPALLKVSDVSVGRVRAVSFEVREGEIVGIAGLLGAGRSTLLEALFGARRLDRGTVHVGEDPLDLRSPARAMAAGVALVPEQRERAIFPGQSLNENLSIADLTPFWRRGRVDRRAERGAAADDVATFGIVAGSTGAAASTLSGGNQQKAVLARWLRRHPRVLLLDEPTLGVDVGARAEIHALIRRYVAGGRAVLCVSSEVEELCALCDRILVLDGGRLTHAVDAADATADLLNQLVHGGAAA